MKQIIIAFVVFTCAASFSSFRPRPATVPASFYEQFHGAQNVNWTEVDGMIRVAFSMEGRHQYAFYSDNRLVVLATTLTEKDLPYSLRQELKNYSNYQLSQTYVLENGSVKEYYAVLDDGTNHITLQGKKHWKVFLKDRK